jgi:hypothetical protein
MPAPRRRGGQNPSGQQRQQETEILYRDDPKYIDELGVEPGDKDKKLENDIRERIESWKGFPAKPGQVAALYYALHGSQDVLLQAPTGYGKSVIWDLMYELGDRTVLMISPLNMLTEQQVENLPEGSNGLALMHHNNNKDTMKRILNDEYTHSMLPL